MRPTEELSFDGRTQFQSTVLRVAGICRRSIAVLDHDLADWPFELADGERVLREALVRGAAVRILLARTDRVERGADRLLRLRRDHSARIEIRVLPQTLRIAESLLIGDRQHVVRRAHRETLRGTGVIAGPSRAEPACERFDAAWQESAPCLPPTTLGLA